MSSATVQQAIGPWRQVTAKADAFFERTQARHAKRMSCRQGCTLCCQTDLTVLLVEAVAIAVHLRRLPPSVQDRLAVGGRGSGPPCAMLVGDRCAVYDSRPLICRTHGLPVAHDANNGHADPDAPIDVCALNFTDRLPADAVLHGGRLVAGLTVADALARRQLGQLDPHRFALRDIATSRGQTVLEKIGRDCWPAR